MNKMPVSVVYTKIADPIYERMQAQVKFFDIPKGFGFLKRPNKPDIFFTAKSLEKAKIKSVQENDLIEFDYQPVEGKGGKALNLKKVSK